MPDLATFQRDFAAALAGDGPSGQPEAFAVYRNTAARGVVEALRAAFPTVDRLVGEEMFTAVALDFRHSEPPASPVLSDYGAGFPDFLARQPWTTELPYLADVARLDWLWLDSLLAADWAPYQPTGSGEPRVRLHPAARFAWLSTPALTIWQAHRNDGSPGPLEPVWQEERALFTRPAMSVGVQAIDAASHHLLRVCRSTNSLAACANAVGTAFPEADVLALLRHCVAVGALIVL